MAEVQQLTSNLASKFTNVDFYDVLLTFIAFKVVGPAITEMGFFNQSMLLKYVGTFLSLFIVPLFFNIRTPNVKLLFDWNGNILIKLAASYILLKVVVDDPKPGLMLTEF